MRHARWCPALLTVAFAIRLAAALTLDAALAREGRLCVFPDTTRYMGAGRTLESEGVLRDPAGNRAQPAPGYPFLVAAASRAVRVLVPRAEDPVRATALALRVLQAGLGTGAVACGMVLAFSLGGGRAGFIAGVFLALWPHGIGYDALLLSESLAIFLLMLQLALLRAGGWDGLTARRAFLAGVAGAGLALTRPVLLLAAILPVVPLLVLRARRGRIAAAAMLAGLALGLAPWLARNAFVTGAFPLLTSRSGHDLYVALGPEADGGPANRYDWNRLEAGLGEAEASRRLSSLALRAVADDPIRVVRLIPVKWARFWNPFPNPRAYRHPAICIGTSVAVLLWLPLAGVCLARLARPDALLLALPVLTLWLAHSVWIASIRYRLPVEPLLAILAALTLAGGRYTDPRGRMRHAKGV